MSVPYPEFKEELDKRIPELDSEPLMDLIGEPKGRRKISKENPYYSLLRSRKEIHPTTLLSSPLLGSMGGYIGYLYAKFAGGFSDPVSIGLGASAGTMLGFMFFYFENPGFLLNRLTPKEDKKELELHEPEKWEKPYTPENIADQVAEKKLEELI